jgi:uncharacterized damage-inducible protein DinB
MSSVPEDVLIFLVRELEAFQREIALFPDDESLWRTLPGITNSAGNLALHVAGNLRHFVGKVLGGTDYVRDRPTEFNRKAGTRSELIEEIGFAIKVVREVLPGVPEDRLSAIFPAPVIGVPMRTRRLLIHLPVHLAYHLGQA